MVEGGQEGDHRNGNGKIFSMGSGGGGEARVVSVLAFYSIDPSSISR